MRWDLKTADPFAVENLAAKLSSQPSLRLKDPQIASTLARLLVMRGITEAEAAGRFLSPELSHLHSPYLMAGMKTAVDRIEAAIENKESILIYGDYDVDGTTAIVVLKTAIELCGGTADFHVPHRIRDGYDMRDDVIERAAAAGIKLIISVDMGIRAFAPAETARRLGVDLIVGPGLDQARAAVAAGTLPALDATGLRVGPPVARPGAVLCIGMNYAAHAAETGAAPPKRPVLFYKAPNTVVGPDDTVLNPRGATKLDWEVELAVVIGTRVRYLESPQRGTGTRRRVRRSATMSPSGISR